MSYTPIEKIEVDERVYEKTLKWLGRNKTEVGESFYNCDEIDERLRRSERALRNALKKGKMRKDVFDALARFIDIDPDYLSGKLFRDIKALNVPGSVKRALIVGMTPEKYRYGMRDTKDAGARYFEDILSLHGISLTQLRQLGRRRELELALAIEHAIVPVLSSFFEVDAAGEDLYPEIWRLAAQIEGAIGDQDMLGLEEAAS